MGHLLRVRLGISYLVETKNFLLKGSWNSMVEPMNGKKITMRPINNSKNKLNNSKRQILTSTAYGGFQLAQLVKSLMVV